MMLTTEQASKEIGYTPEHIRNLYRSNTIQGIKIGRTIYINADSLTRYVKQRTYQDLRELGHHITKTTGRLFCSRCGAAVSGDPLIFEQCKG